MTIRYNITRLCIVAALLLTVSLPVCSQAFRLDVDREPLNKTLNRLGLEISFDDRALSVYSVSVAMTFEDAEKALSWLLEDKPFRVEKVGKVYVIVPYPNEPMEVTRATFQGTGEERYFFRGTVVVQTAVGSPEDAPVRFPDDNNQPQRTGIDADEPLEYATVSLLDNNNQLITAGITNEKGRFTLQTSHIPAKIKISYIGYETLLREIHTLNGELGVFSLKETFIQLDEAVVTADNIRQELNRTIYTVTPQMRYGADNALEMLNNIPGGYYDKASKTVRLNNHTNLLLLVDGIQYSHSYLNHLAPERVQAIEVVYALSGRFVSDDYAGIIHFFLKKDYTGYDVHVSGAASLNLSKTAGNNRLSENHPSVGIVYTTRKLNFFGMYAYNREDRNMHATKSLQYNDSELVSLPPPRHNSLYENENHTITGGLNYHIAPLQLLGVQADYTEGNTATFQEYAMRRTDLSRDYDRILTNTTENRIKDHTFSGSVFYKGQVSNRLHLYGDFSYNYYYNDMENEYRQDEPANYRYFDMWDEYKDQTILNVEGKYTFSNRITLESGYSHIWRQYASQSSQGRGFLDYSEQRNKAFAYLTLYLSNKAGLKSGVALEHIRQRNREDKFSYIRILPFLQLNCKISPTVSVATGYAANQSYPSLYQLSPISIAIDTFLTQIGNPALKSAVRHQVFAELNIGNKFKITPQLNITSDGVSETYDIRENKLYRTFENITYREYSLLASYEQLLGAYFRLKSAVMPYHSEALHQGVRSALNGWIFHAEANYYHPRTSFGLQLGYYRNMKKNILWQGYQMSDRDYWCVTARKELWSNRLSVMLSYIPPVAFGVRYDRTKEMNTPLYKEKTALNLESYNQMLLLQVSLRLERGSAKPTESRTNKRVIERE